MPDKVPAHIARFTSADVCEAAGITLDTLKNWVSREPRIVLFKAEDQPGGSRGVPNLYSLNRVMQIAIMAELARLGWNPRPAAHAAIHFTDIGGAVGAHWEEETPRVRMAGQLFESGITLLVAMPLDTEAAISKVLNVDPGASWSDCWTAIMASLQRRGVSDPAGATVLNLNELDARVRAFLGVSA